MATGNQLLRAYSKAIRKVEKDKRGRLTATKVSAGFIIPPGQMEGHMKGWQVFVELHRYSDDKLRQNPRSGGLL